MKLTKIIKYVIENSCTGFFYTPPIYNSGKCYFFPEIEEEITFDRNDNLSQKLNELDKYTENGFTAFGLIEYEFGYLLEERLKELLSENVNYLFHFLISKNDSVRVANSDELDFTDIENHIGEKVIDNFSLNTPKEEYIKNVEKIKKHIAEGDTYQVNYTVKSEFNLTGSILDLFCQLIFSQSAQYSAIINLGNKIILTSSPELFFEVKNEVVKVKPMKGTIKRGVNLVDDQKQTKELLSSEKDRAENIMIVDLLRNDIGKISEFGSVKVTNQYNLEKYESVHQLTSDVIGRLKTNKPSQIINNLFPSGSITGAPKLRTMEIINELEKDKRGVYTGLIGIFSKKHNIANVAIRTLEIDRLNKSGSLGIGSGIVWDSDSEKEYEEVLLKSKFLTEPTKYFELLETMLYENGKIFLFDYHLKRLEKAASYFLFKYDEEIIKNQLDDFITDFDKNKLYKIRLTLSKWGRVAISSNMIECEKENINIVVSNKLIDTKNRFQYFKTTNRNLYDDELKKYRNEGYFEALYLNEIGNIAEGAISNILIKNDKKLFTPPIEDGILNGCYRQFLIEQSEIEERSITLEQLINSEKVILINSVRKELVVDKIFDSAGKLLKIFD